MIYIVFESYKREDHLVSDTKFQSSKPTKLKLKLTFFYAKIFALKSIKYPSNTIAHVF